MPLPWNPNSNAKQGLEHENVGYAAARIAGPADWLALKFTALNNDTLHGIWFQSDSGAAAPDHVTSPTNIAAGLRSPLCVDVYRAGDEVQGEPTITQCIPTGFETSGQILDETLTTMEIGDVGAEGDGLFIMSGNTVSHAQFGFNAVTGVGDSQHILDVRYRIWFRKSARVYRVDDKAVGAAPGTYFFLDRAEGTAYTIWDVLNGDAFVDSQLSPQQWSRWTPTEVKEFRDAGKRRWRWRPLTAIQGRLDHCRLIVTHVLDRRIGHGVAQAPDTPFTWFRVPIWLPTASGSGAGPALTTGEQYVIVVRRMNAYAQHAEYVTAPLRYIRHPSPPVNWELWTAATEKFVSSGGRIVVYKNAGLDAQVHGLLAAAIENSSAGALGDHTQPYTLSRPAAVYNGKDAVQYWTTPSSPGTNHGQVYVTVSTDDPQGKPLADLRVQVELASSGATVLGPAALSVKSANLAPLVHDAVGEGGRRFHRAHIQFPATFTFTGSTRYRIRFSSSTTSARRWWIGALLYSTHTPPYTLGPQSWAGAADEAQGEVAIGGAYVPLGSDNILSFHHSTVDESSPMDTGAGWQEGTNTAVGRSVLQVLHGTKSVGITRLVSTGDAQFHHHPNSPPYAAVSGQQFTAAASYRAKATSRSVRVDLQWLDSAGAVLSTTTGTSAADATGSWTQVTVTGTAPASTARVRVRYTVLAAVANEVHFMDQAGLWLAAAAPAWTVGPVVRGDLQAVVAALPTAPTGLAATVKNFDLSPPDCLGHNHLSTEISGSTFTDATTPDNAALDITGNTALAWYGALDHYEGTDQFVGGKWTGPSNKSYGLIFTADGHLGVVYSTDGAAERMVPSPLPHNFIDGQPWAVAVEITTNIFGVFHGATFFVSYDKGATWVPLGATQLRTGTITLFSGTSIASVGQAGDATRPAPGRHYWFRIYNGTLAAGTQVANPIFTDDAVGQTSDTDAAGRVWTIDAGALQAPDPNCCCTDPSRIVNLPFVQLTWTATAHSTSFVRYVIQRNDDGFWRDVAYLNQEGFTVWNDWSPRLGKQACYRMRVEISTGQVSAWAPSAGLGMVCVSIPKPAAGLYLTSDVSPTFNVAYVDVYDSGDERTWTFLEYGDVNLHANHGVERQVALHPIERRGDQFARQVILQAICEDGRYGVNNPLGAPPLEISRPLRELTWADIPYVIVRDHEGHRWYANVQVPSVSARPDPLAWQANLEIAEVADEPAPVVT